MMCEEQHAVRNYIVRRHLLHHWQGWNGKLSTQSCSWLIVGVPGYQERQDQGQREVLSCCWFFEVSCCCSLVSWFSRKGQWDPPSFVLRRPFLCELLFPLKYGVLRLLGHNFILHLFLLWHLLNTNAVYSRALWGVLVSPCSCIISRF